MKLPFLVCLATFMRGARPAPKPPTVSQLGIQAKAIRHLIAHGRIDARTVLDMGINDTGKLFTRLRLLGLLHEADNECGHFWRPNHSGHGRYKVHRWTGNYPPGWDDYKPERRKSVRGGQV